MYDNIEWHLQLEHLLCNMQEKFSSIYNKNTPSSRPVGFFILSNFSQTWEAWDMKEHLDQQ